MALFNNIPFFGVNNSVTNLYNGALDIAKQTTIKKVTDPVEQAEKEATEVTVPPPTDKKGISTVTGANIATGINTIANVAASLYGAKMASKMQPSLISKPTEIEPVLITDKTSAVESAGKENIEKSINTAKSSLVTIQNFKKY